MKRDKGGALEARHLVLKHLKTGKVASRPDQLQRAIELEAVQLTESGAGGGIVTLLLPKSAEAFAKIDGIREVYEVVRVKSRTGKPDEQTVRQMVRAGVQNDALMVTLCALFAAQVGDTPGPQATSIKAFTHWLNIQLKNKKSRAYNTMAKMAPELLADQRSDRWWADAIARRKKTQS